MAYSFFKLNIIPLFRFKTREVGGLENLPANQNFIIAANHNTWIDPVYFVSNLTKVIKKRIYFIAGSKKYFGLGIITINKKNKKKTVDKALSYLKRGRIIFLFVEGRSNPTKTLNKPKTGAARLALRSRQPVIPAGIIGTRGNSALGSLFWEFIWPKKVTLKIGRPLTFEKYYGRAETKELLEEISNIIIKEIAKLCRKKMPAETYL